MYIYVLQHPLHIHTWRETDHRANKPKFESEEKQIIWQTSPYLHVKRHINLWVDEPWSLLWAYMCELNKLRK